MKVRLRFLLLEVDKKLGPLILAMGGNKWTARMWEKDISSSKS